MGLRLRPVGLRYRQVGLQSSFLGLHFQHICVRLRFPYLYSIEQSTTIIERHLPQVHAYADDTQLYVAFKPDPEHAANAVAAMEACINDIRKWMLADRLKINDDKTEFLVIGTRQQLEKVNIDSINVGTVEVSSSSEVKNLGCWLDNQLKLNSHINRLCKSAFFHLYNIRKN